MNFNVAVPSAANYRNAVRLTFAVAAIFALGLAAVPVRDEPMHIVKFENEYVLVIDATVPVGEATLFHTHAIDNVPVAIHAGRLRAELTDGGSVTESEVVRGAVSFAPGGYTHKITNIGDTPLRFVDAEILSSPGTPFEAPVLDDVPGYTAILENEHVRIYRVILDPGASTGTHRIPRPSLTVVVQGGRVHVDSETEGRFTALYGPGDFRWHGAPRSHAVTNVGSTPVEYVEIEWK